MKFVITLVAILGANPALSGPAETLTEALENASGGEVIVLPDGNYGEVTITRAFPGEVTIRSANPLGATMTTLNIAGASNLRIESVHVSGAGNGDQGVGFVNIDGGSHDIQFVSSEVNGLKDGTYSGSYGIRVENATDVTVQNNNVHDVQDGVVGLYSSKVSVIGNTIDYIGNDVMKFAAVNSLLVEDNTSWGHIYASADAHVDFIQVFGDTANDITIRGNLYLASTWADVQGIFIAENVSTFNDVLIEDNIIQTGVINGIVVSAGSGITVRDNTLINIPASIHRATLIFAPPDATVTGNITTSYEGGMTGGNLTMQNVSPGMPFYVDLYFARADAPIGQLRLEDLRPVDGSLVTVVGATRRLSEVLK